RTQESERKSGFKGSRGIYGILRLLRVVFYSSSRRHPPVTKSFKHRRVPSHTQGALFHVESAIQFAVPLPQEIRVGNIRRRSPQRYLSQRFSVPIRERRLHL